MPIVITNFTNNETLSYRLPLFEGFIKRGLIKVNGEITTIIGSLSFKWPIFQGHFKALVPLSFGKNNIIFSWSNESLEFVLFFSKLPSPRHYIRLVYIHCQDHDGSFQAPPYVENSMESAMLRIRLAAEMIQSFTAESMKNHGLGRKTFALEVESKSACTVCHTFKSKLTLSQARSMDQDELWIHFGKEIMASNLRDDECKFLAFASFTQYTWIQGMEVPLRHDDILKLTQGHAALGGGGLALFGTGCLHTWAEDLSQVPTFFANSTLIDRRLLMDDSANRGFFWACYSTGLGAILHELGHTFDLGHTATGIMARADNMHRAFVVTPNPTDLQISKHPSTNMDKPLETGSSTTSRIMQEGPFWDRSSAVFLHFHKWFNAKREGTPVDCLEFDGSTISSVHGIGIIHARNSEGLTLGHLEFLEAQPKILNVAETFLPSRSWFSFIHTLVIQDFHGNLIKVLFRAKENISDKFNNN